MGFFGKQPVDPAKCSVTYLWTGLRTPGIFSVTVEGDAPNYSYGFSLVRDSHFVGGLKVDAMGWTGPLGKGTTPYKVQHSFNGEFKPKVVISGSNGDFLIDVKEIPYDQVDDYVKSKAG
ncbi:hypothetical protein M0D21_17775 [Aquimarina sp. D1M17]|uniref:hypothetical protein n=1 Tax=Aquimarina acroporae TaxID=2937283 RepID=UPI0020BFE0EE|nr:hypothetical protein [Aquimarina acroporae]MCK8523436.1 hypothetical protein [Aquimarina acroporae]